MLRLSKVFSAIFVNVYPPRFSEKIGNALLRWAFAEAACLFLRSRDRAKKWKKRKKGVRL
jgi:hypothetical protein